MTAIANPDFTRLIIEAGCQFAAHGGQQTIEMELTLPPFAIAGKPCQMAVRVKLTPTSIATKE